MIPAAFEGPTRRRRIGILAICSMGLLMSSLDVMIVNVALPSIGRQFHAPVSGLQWTIDAYTLVICSLLMLAGSTADRVGRKRVFCVGMVIFTLGSLLCSLAPSLEMLVVFRMVQAVGASMLAPVAMSIITHTFTDRRERARAIGVWGAVTGVSLALGPVVGGILVSASGWRAIFWVNVPIGIVGTALSLRYLPESRGRQARRVDPVGQVLVVVVLAATTYGIIEAPRSGLTSAKILGVFALAAVAAAILVPYELRRAQPLIELRFFRSVPFASATGVAVALFAGMGGFLFMNTLYLQDGRGLSALHAGLDTLPAAAATIVAAPLSGVLVGRRGSRLPLVVAGAALCASSVMLATITATTPFTWLFAAYVIWGVGYGIGNTPISTTAVSGMPLDQAGVAAGLASAARQVGQTLGVAFSGALVSASVRNGHLAAALPAATHPGWWLLAAAGVVVVVLGVVSTTAWARRTAVQTAEARNPEGVRYTEAGLGSHSARARAVAE